MVVANPTPGETVGKGHSIREVENHRSRGIRTVHWKQSYFSLGKMAPSRMLPG